MRRQAGHHVARTDDHGFVLVGVVMFVLALTILGLSLFALSSYEGQFMNRSYDSDQAFYTAQSGIEHAKFVLARGGRLEDVGTSLFPSGVVYASAHLVDGTDPDSIGAFPQQDSVELRVMANVNGERRMLAARFRSFTGPGLYKNLMRASDSLMTEADGADSVAGSANYSLQGDVYDGGMAGGGWLNNVQLPWPNRIPAASPEPDVQSFFDDHYATATDAVIPDLGAKVPYSLTTLAGPPPLVSGQPPQVRFYRTENSDLKNSQNSLRFEQYQFNVDAGVREINVNGWVVWMLKNGFHSDPLLKVTGNNAPIGPGLPGDCLVIVAGISSDPDGPPYPGIGHLHGFGFDFSSGIQSVRTPGLQTTVPVILVTNGWVFNEQFFPPSNQSAESVPYLSIFAHGISLWGPYKKQKFMTLDHDTSQGYDDPKGLIDQLIDQDALPNADAGRMKFKAVAGTWRELDPDHPDIPLPN